MKSYKPFPSEGWGYSKHIYTKVQSNKYVLHYLFSKPKLKQLYPQGTTKAFDGDEN